MKYDQLVQNIQELDLSLAKQAASAVNVSLNIRNWMVGGWIVHYEQDGLDRAEYGDRLILSLADSLCLKGLGKRNLDYCRSFFLSYPQIVQTLSAQFEGAILRPDIFAGRFEFLNP